MLSLSQIVLSSKIKKYHVAIFLHACPQIVVFVVVVFFIEFAISHNDATRNIKSRMRRFMYVCELRRNFANLMLNQN